MNMSYCRFENTSKDLHDCLIAIEDGEHKDLNRYEKEGLQNILYYCEEILKMQDEIEDELNSENE